MKKVIISVVATVCVMSIIFGIVIVNIMNTHETKIAATRSACEERIEILENENNDSELRIQELEQQIWNIMEGNEYNVTIRTGENDTKTVTYKGEPSTTGILGNWITRNTKLESGK